MMRLLAYVVLMIVLAWAPAFATQQKVGEPSTREEFEAFWERYIKALASMDDKELLPLVEFPFSTQGTQDFDPQRALTPEQFKLVLTQLLANDVGTLELPTSMHEYLQGKLTFSDQEILAGEVRVGNFKFHKTDGQWKWYFAYYDLPATP